MLSGHENDGYLRYLSFPRASSKLRQAMCLGCCSVVVLEDSDVVHLTRGGYAIYNAAREDPAACVPRLLRTLDMEVSSIMKGGYDHYMQKEIHEQPESILQTMRGRVKFSRVVPKVCRRTSTDVSGRLVTQFCVHPQSNLSMIQGVLLRSHHVTRRARLYSICMHASYAGRRGMGPLHGAADQAGWPGGVRSDHSAGPAAHVCGVRDVLPCVSGLPPDNGGDC